MQSLLERIETTHGQDLQRDRNRLIELLAMGDNAPKGAEAELSDLMRKLGLSLEDVRAQAQTVTELQRILPEMETRPELEARYESARQCLEGAKVTRDQKLHAANRARADAHQAAEAQFGRVQDAAAQTRIELEQLASAEARFNEIRAKSPELAGAVAQALGIALPEPDLQPDNHQPSPAPPAEDLPRERPRGTGAWGRARRRIDSILAGSAVYEVRQMTNGLIMIADDAGNVAPCSQNDVAWESTRRN